MFGENLKPKASSSSVPELPHVFQCWYPLHYHQLWLIFLTKSHIYFNGPCFLPTQLTQALHYWKYLKFSSLKLCDGPYLFLTITVEDVYFEMSVLVFESMSTRIHWTPAQDWTLQCSLMVWGGVRETLLFPEELLTVNGCSGRTCHWLLWYTTEELAVEKGIRGEGRGITELHGWI